MDSISTLTLFSPIAWEGLGFLSALSPGLPAISTKAKVVFPLFHVTGPFDMNKVLKFELLK